jgi:hypothetical protein
MLLCLVFLTSCKNDENVEKTKNWIEKAPRPIMVRFHSLNGITLEKRYTLIDSIGNVYNTGCVELSLPDTLK